MEHELLLTKLFNDYLAGPVNAALSLVGMPTEARPWGNWLAVEVFVAIMIMLVALVIRGSLSADKPGGLQHFFESVYEFIKKSAADAGVEQPDKYMAYFATIFIFIASMNLIGIIPAFESPTMFVWVPAGLALWTFLYFNVAGFYTNGLAYLKHFAGPIWWMAPLMFPIEIISVFIRPMSLTVRLYGNMFAGEQVTLVFITITKLIVPVIFMGLHVAVGLVQAYVFTMLTMIYIAGATATHSHHGEGNNEENVHAPVH
ncbi:MAG: F0F1 ATP synthase subunit A [Acidobacteriota bacterium]